MSPVVRKVLQAQKLLPLDGGVQEGGTGEPETIWNLFSSQLRKCCIGRLWIKGMDLLVN